MTDFLATIAPTPFGFFDADTSFQSEADAMVMYVKRKLGDDVLSVELTKKHAQTSFFVSSTDKTSSPSFRVTYMTMASASD